MASKKTFDLQTLSTFTNCPLEGDPRHVISGVADLESATADDASFFSNERYTQALKKSRAGVIFIHQEIVREAGKNYLISPLPSHSFQQVVDLFYPQRMSPSGFKGIHPTAVIHETALLGVKVTVGPHAVIDEGAVIGPSTFIGAGTYIGPETVIGEACVIHPNVTIREGSQIGNRVIIQPGAVIGSCGFGYITDKQGKHLKLNQVGNVVLEDDTEIGANTSIDRARFKSTRVGKGSKIDNLVQLGHGVDLGHHNIIIAQTGIAGSTTTGKHVILAGQVAVAGHLHLSNNVAVAAKSGVTKSLTSGKYGGFPALPLEEYNRNLVILRTIDKYIALIKSAIHRIEKIEKSCTENLPSPPL